MSGARAAVQHGSARRPRAPRVARSFGGLRALGKTCGYQCTRRRPARPRPVHESSTSQSAHTCAPTSVRTTGSARDVPLEHLLESTAIEHLLHLIHTPDVLEVEEHLGGRDGWRRDSRYPVVRSHRARPIRRWPVVAVPARLEQTSTPAGRSLSCRRSRRTRCASPCCSDPSRRTLQTRPARAGREWPTDARRRGRMVRKRYARLLRLERGLDLPRVDLIDLVGYVGGVHQRALSLVLRQVRLRNDQSALNRRVLRCAAVIAPWGSGFSIGVSVSPRPISPSRGHAPR